jgi:hypothetical protein
MTISGALRNEAIKCGELLTSFGKTIHRTPAIFISNISKPLGPAKALAERAASNNSDFN